MSYSPTFARTKPTYARAEATTQRARPGWRRSRRAGGANDRLRQLQQPPIGVGSSLEEPAPVSLVTHKGGSNAEVMALHDCPRDPWVSRRLSRGCNGPN